MRSFNSFKLDLAKGYAHYGRIEMIIHKYILEVKKHYLNKWAMKNLTKCCHNLENIKFTFDRRNKKIGFGTWLRRTIKMKITINNAVWKWKLRNTERRLAEMYSLRV